MGFHDGQGRGRRLARPEAGRPSAAGREREKPGFPTSEKREGGTCFTSAIHSAPEVGLVRYSFRQIDPAANAVVVVGIKELSYVRLDKGV